MQAEIVLPKNHILNRNNLEEFQCCICFELSTKTHRCCGPCKKAFCLKCIGRIKFSKNYCPNKCSTPFLTEKIPELEFKFTCPYDPEHCTLIFETEEEFSTHSKECPFMSLSAKTEAKNRRKFRCTKGHPLVIITDELIKEMESMQNSFFTTVMNDFCSGCGSRNLCRAFCSWCSTAKNRHMYCVQCRRLPLTKVKCPVGHLWTKKEILASNFGSVCDICGLSGSLRSSTGYVEHDCDIFICEPCYKQLPEPVEEPKKRILMNKHQNSSLFGRERSRTL